MNVGSLFSGIGGIDLGLERAGHRVVFQCEADPYRRRVLARHWPGVPCFEDVVRLGRLQSGRGDGCDAPADAWPSEVANGVDLLCGGFPCQDLSVAGRRAGLDGARSGLFFEFARVADALLSDGGWLLIENVPGLLSSHGGRDFAVLLSTLGELGFHDLAWRVLDSRYLGVPQRRRRVFILARRARGRRAAEVLLEPESGGGDFEAGREARSRVAASLSRGSAGAGVSAPGRRQEDDENIVANTLTTAANSSRRDDAHESTYVPAIIKRYGKGTDSDATDGLVVNALDSQGGGPDDNSAQAGHLIAHTLRAEGFDASEDGTGRGTPLTVAGALGGGNHGAGRRSEFDPNLVCPPADSDRMRAPSGVPGRVDANRSGERSAPSEMGSDPSAAVCAHDLRPDGPRYAACGDAVTVNVSEWIGRRLMEAA